MLRKSLIGGFRRLVVSGSFGALLFACQMASGVSFSGGVVAERIGGDANFAAGSALVSGTGTAIFVDEFSRTTNARLQTVALPATDPDAGGPQRSIVENGSSSNVGFMSRSTDGNYLVTVGYGVDAGATGLPGSA